MAAFTKVYQFIEDVYSAVHDFKTDDFALVLTDVAPVATDVDLTDLTEIANGNGYTAGGIPMTVISAEQTLGVLKVLVDDVLVTSDTGNLGPFRYGVMINTSKSDKIVGSWDRGSSITLDGTQGDTFNFLIHDTNGILQDS